MCSQFILLFYEIIWSVKLKIFTISHLLLLSLIFQYKHQYAEHLCNISHKNVLDARLRLPNDITIDKAEENTLLNILQR